MSEADNSSNKKVKDRIQQLSELRRGLVHYTDAQYGTANDPVFVMRVNIDGMVSIVCVSTAFNGQHSRITYQLLSYYIDCNSVSLVSSSCILHYLNMLLCCHWC